MENHAYRPNTAIPHETLPAYNKLISATFCHLASSLLLIIGNFSKSVHIICVSFLVNNPSFYV